MNRKLSVRIASILLILHGLIELAGLVFINSMPHALISFGGLTGPALKQNAATIAILGALWGIARLIAAVGAWSLRKWALILGISLSTITFCCDYDYSSWSHRWFWLCPQPFCFMRGLEMKGKEVNMTMVISQLGLKPDALRGETVIVTGAGGGIGYEAARALLWLGANVVIAEINQQNGRQAEVQWKRNSAKNVCCSSRPMWAMRKV
jgi:hypothetical protein